MIQINLQSIYVNILKHWSKIALVIVSFFLWKSCKSGELSTVKIEEHKKREKQYISDAKKIEYEKDLFKDTIKFLEAQNQKRQTEVVDLTKKLKSKISDIKKYNSSDIANYYKDRYKLPNEIKTTNLGTALTDKVARLNITDLVIGDGAKSELKITKNILLNTQIIVVQKDSIIKITETQNSLLILANNESNEAFNKQGKDAEKSLKAQKNKTLFWKTTTGAVIIGAGYLLLKK